VDVSCPASVMTWEVRLELNDTFLVTFLDTSVEGRVEVGLIVRVPVSTGDDSRIDTL
jgi:hypothetical protein